MLKRFWKWLFPSDTLLERLDYYEPNGPVVAYYEAICYLMKANSMSEERAIRLFDAYLAFLGGTPHKDELLGIAIELSEQTRLRRADFS